MEFIANQVKECDYDLNGYWITFARDNGWSDSDIKDIMRASDPTAVGLKMYERILSTEKAILKQDLDKRMAIYDQQRAAVLGTVTAASSGSNSSSSSGSGSNSSSSSTKDKDKDNVEVKVKDKDNVEVNVNVNAKVNETKTTGLRARFSSKQAENQQSTTDTQQPKSAGISSRLKQMKQVTETNEQDSTLFVRNVPEDYQEQDIKTVIGERFNVSRINIVRKTQSNGERASTGSAFIVLYNREDAVACMEFLQGYRWCNIIASVDLSQPKKVAY